MDWGVSMGMGGGKGSRKMGWREGGSSNDHLRVYVYHIEAFNPRGTGPGLEASRHFHCG